jgi:hypothetical protein
VLAEKGQKSVHTWTGNDEKESITALFTASADGTLAPSLVLMAYQRIPAFISMSMPKKWGLGCSEKGWMTGETFYEYIANVFYPFLKEKNTVFPVILFLDGHSSHLTLTLSKFCKEKQIILVALLPNATHLLQPLDVAFFHPLKISWKKVVKKWRIENYCKKIKKELFAPLLEEALKNVNNTKNIISGFKVTGLYPFDCNAIDYNKLFSTHLRKPFGSTSTPISESNKNLNVFQHLKYLESEIGTTTLIEFKKQFSNKEWSGEKEDQNLFYLWKKIKTKVNG